MREIRIRRRRQRLVLHLLLHLIPGSRQLQVRHLLSFGELHIVRVHRLLLLLNTKPIFSLCSIDSRWKSIVLRCSNLHRRLLSSPQLRLDLIRVRLQQFLRSVRMLKIQTTFHYSRHYTITELRIAKLTSLRTAAKISSIEMASAAQTHRAPLARKLNDTIFINGL